MDVHQAQGNNTALQKIHLALPGLPKRQKAVCEYVINNYKEIPFLTAIELADKIGTSSSTVVRTVARLGFDSFASFKEEIRERVVETITPPLQRMKIALDQEIDSCELVLEKVVRVNAECVQSMFTNDLVKNYCAAVERLVKAKRIFILGLRSSRGIAVYFHSLLHQCTKNVYLLDPGGSDDLVEHLLDLTPEDVFVSIISTWRRYVKRSELAVKYARDHNIPCILLTNDMSSRAASLTDIVLLAPQRPYYYSVVSFMTLVDALVLGIALRNKTDSNERIEKAGPLLLNFGIFF